METKGLPTITFGSQMGDQKVAEIVQPLLIELRRLLKIYCNNNYSKEIKEFAPIARIDGDIWSWNFEGCQKMRLSRKEKYITVDVGVPRQRWENKSETEIKVYLFNGLREAVNLMLIKLKKEKIHVEEENLLNDLLVVEREYLGNIQ